MIRHDFAAAKGSLKPGIQLAGNYEHRFGNENPVVFTLFMDTKQIFRTLEDTPEELGLTSSLVGTVLVPLWGGFNLNLTTDAFFFNGKLESNRNVGTNLKTLVGISYGNLWKRRM
ncbi:MAG TPA: hypothetical protein DD435_02010 [Cyanobacteria bacterium UBA8530]|nr:hypothetical protein [Cyanobacteria bacterium UBA8530]